MMSWRFVQRVTRAFSQRIYLLDSVYVPDNDGNVNDKGNFAILGNSRSVYHVSVGDQITCTCPDYTYNEHFCKHCIFVSMRVLGLVYAEIMTRYQKSDRLVDARVRRSLVEYFQNTKALDPLLTATPQKYIEYHKALQKGKDSTPRQAIQQRTLTENDRCPICFEGLDALKEALVFCEYGCGHSLHGECFTLWARQHKTPTCVYCRAPWFKSPSHAEPINNTEAKYEYVHIRLPKRGRSHTTE